MWDDASYTGEIYDPTSASRFFDLDYYRDKVREFQSSLNELDATARIMRDIAAMPLPPAEYQETVDWLTDYESNRERAIYAAQAINAAANAANAAGIRMPVLSWGTSALAGVGAVPPAIIAGAAAAIGAGAWFLSYAVDRIATARGIAQRAALLAEVPPEQRAELLKREQEIALAEARAQSPISAVADVVKWVAVGAAVFFAFRAFQEYRSA